MRPAAGIALAAAVLLLAGGAAAGWVMADAAVSAAEERPPVAGRDQRASQRPFMTADSLTIDGSQIIVQSRGTLILVHGVGDHHPWLTTAAGALADSLGFHLIGLSLRGQGATAGSATAPRRYERDVQAVITELKRREPSGPVIVVGRRTGAAIVLRTLLEAGRGQRPSADGLILVNPVLDWCAAGAGLTWPRPLRQWPRRLALAGATRWLPTAVRQRLVVATERPTVSERGAAAYAASDWQRFCVAPDAATWRAAEMPVQYLAPVAPGADAYPQDARHEWRAVPADAEFDDRLLPVLRDFMSQFADAAVYRTPVRAGTVVPVLPR